MHTEHNAIKRKGRRRGRTINRREPGFLEICGNTTEQGNNWTATPTERIKSMTVKEFLTDLQDTGNEAFAEQMQNTVHVWNNNACRGYCVAALQKAGYTREQIAGVLDELTAAFEEISVDDAARIRNA